MVPIIDANKIYLLITESDFKTNVKDTNFLV